MQVAGSAHLSIQIQIVPFARKRKLDHLEIIRLLGMEMKRETGAKYLGIKHNTLEVPQQDKNGDASRKCYTLQ